MKATLMLAAAAAALAAPALAVDSPSAQSGRKLSTTLSGGTEVPGPGDPDGNGSFTARVNPGQGSLCYELAWRDIGTARAAHIHTGAAGVAGGVVVPLTVEADGTSAACVVITRALAQSLIKNPQGFYVNVHTAAFPAGAIRGQLRKN